MRTVSSGTLARERVPVSVEAAVSCPGIHVCAFEYKEEAVELIRANCEKARTEAVTIVPERRRRHLHR